MRINEVIYFTHELDLLETHLEEHQHFVDKFFIKESPVFWTGPKKPLVFQENKKRFEQFNIKHIVIPSEEFDLSIPTKFPKSEFKKWFDVRRNNRIKSRTYEWDHICKDSDYVFSMDCDEIIDSNRAYKLIEILKSKEYEHVAITLQQHQFWINVPGRKLELYRVFRSDIPYRSQVKGFPRTKTPLIGWHFTNCYDPEGIRTKALGITTHYGLCGIDNVPSADSIESDLNNHKNPFKTRWSKGKLVNDSDPITETYLKNRILSKDDLSWAPKFIRENPERFSWL